MKYDYDEFYILPAHPNSFAAWLFKLAHGKLEYWKAVETVWRYGLGLHERP